MSVSPEHLSAWRRFLEVHAALTRALERDMAAVDGLALSWYDVLVQLHEAGDRMRIGDLADHILISRSATTRFIERMEKAGLVCRETAADDRRGTYVCLTPSGFETLQRAAPNHLAGVQEFFGGRLTSAEARQLLELLEKLPVRDDLA